MRSRREGLRCGRCLECAVSGGGGATASGPVMRSVNGYWTRVSNLPLATALAFHHSTSAPPQLHEQKFHVFIRIDSLRRILEIECLARWIYCSEIGLLNDGVILHSGMHVNIPLISLPNIVMKAPMMCERWYLKIIISQTERPLVMHSVVSVVIFKHPCRPVNPARLRPRHAARRSIRRLTSPHLPQAGRGL